MRLSQDGQLAATAMPAAYQRVAHQQGPAGARTESDPHPARFVLWSAACQHVRRRSCADYGVAGARHHAETWKSRLGGTTADSSSPMSAARSTASLRDVTLSLR
jgi:hypothetical protein